MEVKDILLLPAAKAVAAFTAGVDYAVIDGYIKEYGGTHTILDRANKVLTDKTEVITAKLVINLQKRIVNSSTFFLFGGDMRINMQTKADPTDQETEAYEYFKKQWERAKLDTFNRELCRTLLSETRAAELYYQVVETDPVYEAKYRYRVRLLSKSKGDEIYPMYDAFGDMVAFTRQYTEASVNDKGDTVKTIKVVVYTAEAIHTFTKTGEDWLFEKVVNPFKKIPIVFYETKEPDWTIVQGLIDKLEDRFSKFDDTNEYFSSPAILIKGKLKNLPDKGEVGKLFELSEGGDGKFGDVEYLTWDESPEAIKLQLDTLQDLIYSLTDTPNLTLDRLKGLGAFSGAALRFLFMSARMKSKTNQDVFGDGLTRRINLLKAVQTIIKASHAKALAGMDIIYEFGDALPVDENETITNLISSVENRLMSRETALGQHPYIEDAASEFERILNEDIAEPSTGTQVDE